MKLPPYRAFVLLLSLPVILREFFQHSTGAEYDISLRQKLLLALKLVRNNVRITSGSNFVEHLTMATDILRIPKGVDGCIVECGSFKGASTTSLSLVAQLCGRKVEVFDSFVGLPEPTAFDRAHRVMHWGELHTYEKGSWMGTLDEVKANVTRYGAIGSCSFHVGFFEDTLPEFRQPCVFVFEDVDLRGSLETCVEYLWPLLSEGRSFFTHEAPHVEIASLFFSERWWQEHLDCDPPGLVGAGTGLGLIPRPGGFGSALGYAVKAPEAIELKHVPQ